MMLLEHNISLKKIKRQKKYLWSCVYSIALTFRNQVFLQSFEPSTICKVSTRHETRVGANQVVLFAFVQTTGSNDERWLNENTLSTLRRHLKTCLAHLSLSYIILLELTRRYRANTLAHNMTGH